MNSLTPAEGPARTAICVAARWANVRRGVEGGQLLRVADGRMLWLLRDGQPRTLRQLAEELDSGAVDRQPTGPRRPRLRHHRAVQAAGLRLLRGDDERRRGGPLPV
uniref:Uncharacterized protein n=1 Tax=Janibacter limosus TaxID=53458 RepID=A0AC61U4Z2_9MICO|nr:hypothetical protein [Janibacter limosus]